MSSETKTKWFKIMTGTVVLNTATGVLVNTYNEGEATTFIPGEHWDAEAGEFVAIGRGPLHRIPS